MINTEKIFNFENYLKMGLRRKWYILIPFALSIIISFAVYKQLPKEYMASTVILVEAQRVPESYVQPTLTEPMTDRLGTISEEILSRTRLERIVNEFNLNPTAPNKLPMEEIVEMIKKKIEVKLQRQNVFSISFVGTEPRTVMQVTNKLASLFIEENLRLRESRVEGTVQFISKELQTTESNLKKKEDVVRRFKEKNMGQLPGQLEANLRILERLQQQLKTTSDSLKVSQDGIVVLQNQIELEQSMEWQPEKGSSPTRRSLTQGENIRVGQDPGDPLVAELKALKRDLENTESKYTGGHPDVVDLKRKIATLEGRVKKQEEERRQRAPRERQEEMVAGSNLRAASPVLDSPAERPVTQYEVKLKETLAEAGRLKEEIGHLKEQIVLYQKRIEETPKRELEMVDLSRDYDLIKIYYQSLVDKKFQSQMAENLERKQQGEQFRIIDLARLPEKPFKPDRDRVLAVGAALGLAIGLGLAWFRESMDRSFHEVSEVETYLKLPVVATILNLNEEEKKAA